MTIEAKADDFLAIELDGRVAHLKFQSPGKANALDHRFWRELPTALDEIEQDPRLRVIILSGEGRHFCSGLDLDSFTTMQDGRLEVEGARWRINWRRNLEKAQKVLTRLERSRLPVIAAIQGACIGAGLDLACACDLRLASSDAYFCAYEINAGLTPDAGTLPRLAKLIPEGIARELVMSGRRMAAEEAERRGFVNRLAGDAAAVMEAAWTLATELASKAPGAMLGIKDVLDFGRDRPTDDTLRYIAALQAGMICFEDVERAISAQLAGEKPEYGDLFLTDSLFDRQVEQ